MGCYSKQNLVDMHQADQAIIQVAMGRVALLSLENTNSVSGAVAATKPSTCAGCCCQYSRPLAGLTHCADEGLCVSLLAAQHV